MSPRNETITMTDAELDELLKARSDADPVPILKQKAEDRIRRELRTVAIKACSKELGEFAECAKGRLLSVLFVCRPLNKAVDKCMKNFADEEVLQDVIRRRHAVKFPHAVVGFRKSANDPSGPEME